MKTNRLFYIAVALWCISAGALAQSQQYHIQGKLQNISPMPTKLYLKEAVEIGLLSKAVDSAEVKNGEYHFSGLFNADEPVLVNISTDIKGQGTDNITVVIDKGDLNIVSEDALANVKVTGNAALANRQFDEMKGNTKKFTDSLKVIKATEAYKTDKELQRKVTSAMITNAGKTIFTMYSYLKANPNNRISPYGTYLMVALPLLNQTGKDTLVSLLPEKAKADKLGQETIKLYNKNIATRDSLIKAAQAKAMDTQSKIAIGTIAAEITQNNPKGKPVNLSSLKGKYVLIDFWASWCAPCRAENPNVVKLFKQYGSKGFTVFGVSLDAESTKAAWLNAIEHDGLNWTQVSDLKGWANGAAKVYDVRSIPQNFLIDPSGVIIAKNLRGDDLAKKLASLFNK